ncbi:MAG: ATP-dependent helicase HrpA [Myxococcaceae bacterium]
MPDAATDGQRVPWPKSVRSDELLRRAFGVDALTCHACGSPRRVLAFISNLHTVRRILSHLQLPSVTPPLPSATDPPQLSFVPLECA